MFSTTIATLQASPIQLMAEHTRQALAQGRDVVDMTLGEPDFPTPAHICEAAVQAIAQGQTRYTPINGTMALREAIVRKFRRDNAIDCTPADVSVACGGKQVIYQAMLATLNPGDEVMVPAPYWTSYGDIVGLHGARLKPLPTDPARGYALQPQDLEAAITDSTKWLILNSPSNPSGTAYAKEQLLAFADVIRRSRNQRFLVLVDDMYEHILYDGRSFATLASTAPDLVDRILTVNGVSKAYAMTGWRVGFACGPRPLIEAMTKVQMQINSHTASVSQAAAAAALDGPLDEVQRRCAIFQGRRDMFMDRLAAIDGLVVPRPDGAFYLFPDARAYIGRRLPGGSTVENDVALASYLLQQGVALVPGSGFGMPGFLRLSYATSDRNLARAADRLTAAFGQIG